MANIYEAFKEDMKNFNQSNAPIYHIRKAPLNEGAILYDKNGHAAAIKTKGRISAILEGDL